MVGFGTGICRAETVPLNKLVDWEPLQHMVQSSETTIRVFGYRLLISKRIFPYDNNKAYSILGTFKAAPGTKDNYVRVGIQPMDGDKQTLLYYHVNTVPNSDTTLLADVKPADTSMIIADASKWRINGRDVVAFHTDPESKDLPNRHIIEQAPLKLRAQTTGCEVVFAKPIGVHLTKGMGIRLHPTGGYYRWAGNGSSAQGLMNLNCPENLWEQGVKYFHVVVLANSEPLDSGDRRAVLEMHNIKVDIK